MFKEFGFYPSFLNKIIFYPYIHHNDSDIYDRSLPNLGNTNVECRDGFLINKKENENSTSINSSIEKDNVKGFGLDWLFLNDKD